MIKAVAVLRNGEVWTLPAPARHCHILWVMQRVLCWNPTTKEYDPLPREERDVQGFVTDDGVFVDRLEAAAIAIAAGQIVSPRWPPDLYSEDLW